MPTRDSLFNVPLELLRERRSEKWRTFPPDVLPAFVAETDFLMAPSVRAALQRAIELGDTGYAWPGELRQAFSEFALAEYDWPVDPHRVFQVPDVMAGIAHTLLALTPPGCGVVINPPVYSPFFEVLRTIGREPIEVPLRRDESGRWNLDFPALEQAFAKGAKAYVLCSPHNPVGRVWNDADVRRIRELAQQYNVVLIADEIHAPITLSGSSFIPLLRGAPEALRSVSVMSASKAWNIPGLKCGVLVAGSEDVGATLLAHLRTVPTEIESRVGHLGVQASIAAFREGREWLRDLREHLDGNRALLMQLLEEHLPDARCVAPEATYLAWIDCSRLALAAEPSRHFLERGRVALEPGTKYGTGGAGYVRLNFGTSDAILREILTRMRRALEDER